LDFNAAGSIKSDCQEMLRMLVSSIKTSKAKANKL
jgi:hypothetical protein